MPLLLAYYFYYVRFRFVNPFSYRFMMMMMTTMMTSSNSVGCDCC